MSVAPELDGGLRLGRELRKRGILAAIAHSNANYEQVLRALENGYTHITHFYSGCSMTHRENAYRIGPWKTGTPTSPTSTRAAR
jgi:N-acetylglucosamine-6-phosphate deacetylase